MSTAETTALEMLRIIVANAQIIPDPQMNGATDTYSVPLDDIEAARSLIARADAKPDCAEEYADLHAGAVDAMRQWAEEGLGFNCTFVDDDMKVIVGLAQRAVLAGLASDFSPDMQRRFTEAAEKHRDAHAHVLPARADAEWKDAAS